MLDLIRKIYKFWLEIIAWLVLIVGFIGGGQLAGSGMRFSMKGAIIGLITGFLINVFGTGLIATFIEMSNDVKNIKAKLYNESVPSDTVSRVHLLCPSCNAKIRQDDDFCQNCGMKLN